MDTQTLIDELYADPAALQAYQALSAAGGRVFIVGGAVRDTILGKKPKDVDLMVAGIPADQVEAALRALPGPTQFAGKNFGVFHYYNPEDKENKVEIALPRSEHSTGPGHKDFEVQVDHTLPIESDLSRRDFTGNAMAFDIDSQQLIDPFDGEGDLKEGILRLINEQAFVDDPLRIVRAVVAYSVHGLIPDEFTLDQMEVNASRIRNLPGDRIREELDKLLTGEDPAEALRMAHEAGLLEYILPELDVAMGFNQHNVHHDLDVGEHTLTVLEHMTTLTDDPDLRLAALLHDLGKPDSFWQDEEGNGHFYEDPSQPDSANHEEVGADIARSFMTRLHYSKNRINRVTQLVQHHMFPYFQAHSGARKFLNRVGGDPQMAQDLLALRESDAHGKADGTMRPYDEEQIALNRQLLQEVLDKDEAVTVKNLAVSGTDLMALGIPAGPELGRILKDVLLPLVIEDPNLNERETLLEIVRANGES